MEELTKILGAHLHTLANFIVVCLEIIGILLIIYGSVKALIQLIKVKQDFRDVNFKIILGESLASALQFKLGAEIIKTVIIRDTKELLIVGAVVVLRAIITYIIHWEIKQATCEI